MDKRELIKIFRSYPKPYLKVMYRTKDLKNIYEEFSTGNKAKSNWYKDKLIDKIKIAICLYEQIIKEDDLFIRL